MPELKEDKRGRLYEVEDGHSYYIKRGELFLDPDAELDELIELRQFYQTWRSQVAEPMEEED